MAQVLFFNMTDAVTQMTLNGHAADVQEISALPDSPYTPNHNPTEIKRTAEPPRPNEFGEENTLRYEFNDGELSPVEVTIEVDLTIYPAGSDDLLVYLFSDAIVVMAPRDARPFLGRDGETIEVGSRSDQVL